jgi:hypothetical protein
MAQQPYMGSGLLFPSRVHSWQLVTGYPDVSARAIWQAVRNGGFEFSFREDRRMWFFITFKNPSTSVGIEPANLGSSGEHANH